MFNLESRPQGLEGIEMFGVKEYGAIEGCAPPQYGSLGLAPEFFFFKFSIKY